MKRFFVGGLGLCKALAHDTKHLYVEGAFKPQYNLGPMPLSKVWSSPRVPEI